MGKKKAKKQDGAITFKSVTDAPAKQQGGSHLRALDPIPEGVGVDWADKHLESLVPLAAKEKEWQLKFGNDAQRDKVASELLALRGLSAKREQGPAVPPAIILINNNEQSSPFAQRVVEASANPSTPVRRGNALPADTGTGDTVDSGTGAIGVTGTGDKGAR